MQWWMWIAMGAILLGAEMTLISADFYLVFLGIAALIVGLLGLLDWIVAAWLQWLLFAALSVLSMFTFRRWIYERFRRRLPAVSSGPVGQTVVLPEVLNPGQACRLEYCGSSWNAVNGGVHSISAGSRARIDRVDGLTLVVYGE